MPDDDHRLFPSCELLHTLAVRIADLSDALFGERASYQLLVAGIPATKLLFAIRTYPKWFDFHQVGAYYVHGDAGDDLDKFRAVAQVSAFYKLIEACYRAECIMNPDRKPWHEPRVWARSMIRGWPVSPRKEDFPTFFDVREILHSARIQLDTVF